jgi:hypothetical protein
MGSLSSQLRRVFTYSVTVAIVIWGFATELSSAETPDPQIEYLLGRFSQAQTKSGGRFLLSYEGSDRSFLYDQALGVLAFVHADRKSAAEEILTALSRLQSAKGSWHFQYQIVSNQIIPAEDSVSPSGAIAWVAMAIEAYQIKYGTEQPGKYDGTLDKALKYLSSRRVPISWKGATLHPISYSPEKKAIVSFEHNLDAYAAFLNAPKPVNGEDSGSLENSRTASDLRAFLESMWNGNRFNAGFNTEDGQPNRDEMYLDTQSWGVLALGASGSENQDFTQGLKTNCGEFQATAPVAGFVSYHPKGRAPASDSSPVWTEGSLGMMLAMKFSGLHACGGKNLEDLDASMDSLTQKNGGVPYATASSNVDFSTRPSVAGTAWKYFYRKKFNPFHPHAGLHP